MKRFLLGTLLLGLIPSANARVVYIVNHGRINIEERCQDGKALNDKDTQHESRIEQQATGRKEAVRLIHTAAKLKTKFDYYEMS